MAYETKVILTSLANHLAKCDTVEEVYKIVQDMANVEGVVLPSIEEKRKQLSEK